MEVFVNDRFVPEAEAVVPYNDLAVTRGYGVFDFFRMVDGRPIFFADHMHRLQHSAAQLHLQVPYSADAIYEIVLELWKRQPMPTCGIRITVTGGVSSDSYTIGTPNLIVSQMPLKPLLPDDELPAVKVNTYQWIREMAHVKSLNYMTGVWLQPVLQKEALFDALYHDSNGVVSEFPRSNVFAVIQHGKLITPARHILQGITRKYVLELAARQMPVEVRDVTLQELLTASEVFQTNTSRRITPVVSIDGRPIGSGKPGPVAISIYKNMLEKELITG
jgi:D-alanine transaminase/branched-chain amino acid aminotransferase